MEIVKMLAELQQERAQIEGAIIANPKGWRKRRGKRRGRPPVWMAAASAPKRRGRPPGSKNRLKEEPA
jgi:hypothetical protein